MLYFVSNQKVHEKYGLEREISGCRDGETKRADSPVRIAPDYPPFNQLPTVELFTPIRI